MAIDRSGSVLMRFPERGGSLTEIDFQTARNVLVAGGSAADRQEIFDSFRRQLVDCPCQTVSSKDFELAEYDMIDITREALEVYKNAKTAGVRAPDRFLVVEDIGLLVRGDAGFFNESIQTLATLSDWTRYHVVAGLGDTWRGTLCESLMSVFDVRIALRCENAQGYRVALGRTVKNPPGRGEFYCVVKSGRTRICTLAARPTVSA